MLRIIRMVTVNIVLIFKNSFDQTFFSSVGSWVALVWVTIVFCTTTAGSDVDDDDYYDLDNDGDVIDVDEEELEDPFL